MAARVTVTISGPKGSGKSVIAEAIQDALETAGIDLIDPPFAGTRSLDRIWNDAAGVYSNVHIVEKESK